MNYQKLKKKWKSWTMQEKYDSSKDTLNKIKSWFFIRKHGGQNVKRTGVNQEFYIQQN